ncbi:hypothetical protein MRX96_002566 [Rhipicephalus microplus]
MSPPIRPMIAVMLLWRLASVAQPFDDEQLTVVSYKSRTLPVIARNVLREGIGHRLRDSSVPRGFRF